MHAPHACEARVPAQPGAAEPQTANCPGARDPMPDGHPAPSFFLPFLHGRTRFFASWPSPWCNVPCVVLPGVSLNVLSSVPDPPDSG
eukprot:621906-Prymnesium_polylepis.1